MSTEQAKEFHSLLSQSEGSTSQMSTDPPQPPPLELPPVMETPPVAFRRAACAEAAAKRLCTCHD